MKSITIRELHANTGEWVRKAAAHGQILVTDRGETIAKIVPERAKKNSPFFSRRKVSPSMRKLLESKRLNVGSHSDATTMISEDRDERDL